MNKELTQEQQEKLEHQSLQILHLFRQGLGTIEFYYPKSYASNKVFVKGAPVKPEYEGKTKIPRGTKVMAWDKAQHFALNKTEVGMIIGELGRILNNMHKLADHPEMYMTSFPLEFVHYPRGTSTMVQFEISNRGSSIFAITYRVRDVKLKCGLSIAEAYELIEALRSIMYYLAEGDGQYSLHKKFTTTPSYKKEKRPQLSTEDVMIDAEEAFNDE